MRTERGGAAPFSKPVVVRYNNVSVVREDLIPGGTKARFADALFNNIDELVYASPTQGGAQTALAFAARRLNKRLTLFVAATEDENWPDRLRLSERLGAKIVQIPMGFRKIVLAKAQDYVDSQRIIYRRKVRSLDFGFGVDAVEKIAMAAATIPRPKQLWCAAGSGTLARGLAMAWPDVSRFVVQVGRALTPADVDGATIIAYDKPYAYQEKRLPPFPSDPTYERKAYFLMLKHIGNAEATFWNTAASAVEESKRCEAMTDLPVSPKAKRSR